MSIPLPNLRHFLLPTQQPPTPPSLLCNSPQDPLFTLPAYHFRGSHQPSSYTFTFSATPTSVSSGPDIGPIVPWPMWPAWQEPFTAGGSWSRSWCWGGGSGRRSYGVSWGRNVGGGGAFRVGDFGVRGFGAVGEGRPVRVVEEEIVEAEIPEVVMGVVNAVLHDEHEEAQQEAERVVEEQEVLEALDAADWETVHTFNPPSHDIEQRGDSGNASGDGNGCDGHDLNTTAGSRGSACLNGEPDSGANIYVSIPGVSRPSWGKNVTGLNEKERARRDHGPVGFKKPEEQREGGSDGGGVGGLANGRGQQDIVEVVAEEVVANDAAGENDGNDEAGAAVTNDGPVVSGPDNIQMHLTPPSFPGTPHITNNVPATLEIAQPQPTSVSPAPAIITPSPDLPAPEAAKSMQWSQASLAQEEIEMRITQERADAAREGRRARRWDNRRQMFIDAPAGQYGRNNPATFGRQSGHSRRNGAAQQHWGAQYPQTLRPAPGLTADPANLARSQEIQFRADVEEFVPGRAVHGNKAPKA